ncbi:MAG: hypothetical protein ACOYYU_09955 [Chloroflexota bacterium]
MKFSIQFPKLIVLLLIPLSIALFLESFPYGAYFEPRSLAYAFFAGYITDIVQPFGLYFVLCLIEPWLPFLRGWRVKALTVFLLPATMELLQGLGVNALGASFDLLDFPAYAAGGLLAALVERQALARLGFWTDPGLRATLNDSKAARNFRH